MWDLVLPPRLAAAGRILEARLAPPLYRRSTILTLSASSRDEIVRRLRLPASHVGVVPPGVDDRFGPDPGVGRADHPLVLAVGRLMPTKRFDALIRLCAPLRRRHPGLELVIAGEGYERPALEALVAELGAADWVRLVGRVDDDELVALYRRAWVVAATSMAEGWGMTLTEAAACGTPAVATDIAGHRDSVDDGTSGLLGADDAALTAHLDAVLGDADRRRELSEGALRHAKSFTWEATAHGVFAPLAAQATARRPRRR
jgi:glycosyltransferase involved in cell wall biosynthesis